MSELLRRVLAHAARRPDAIAVREGADTVSYAALAAMMDEQRAVLENAGVPGTAPLAIVAHKSAATIAAVLECLRRGSPFLLLSALLPQATRDALVAEAGCVGIVHAADLHLSPLAPAVPRSIPAEIGFMLTTSGSTGRPKIVLLGHQAIDHFTDWAGAAFGIDEHATVLSLAPLNFDLSLLDVWTTLAHGGQVVLIPPAKAVDGAHVLAQVREHGVSVMQGVPMFFHLLLEAAPADLAGPVTLRHVIFTGDDTPGSTLTGLRRLCPGVTMHNLYGCTESNDSLLFTLPPTEPVPDRLPTGHPVAGAVTVLVDDAGRPVHGAGQGELLVSTPFLASGYLDRTLTGQRFITHPSFGTATAFRSGDLFRRDPDGALSLVGRTDFQVKVRGVAVNTAEIERVLALHPAVTASAVVTEADPVGGRRLLAVVERATGTAVTALELRQHCATHLPRTSIPALLRVTEQSLPRTTTGKINREQAKGDYFPATPTQGVLTP